MILLENSFQRLPLRLQNYVKIPGESLYKLELVIDNINLTEHHNVSIYTVMVLYFHCSRLL
jgi:hypothetical protein